MLQKYRITLYAIIAGLAAVIFLPYTASCKRWQGTALR
jgi:hypothetical protein